MQRRNLAFFIFLCFGLVIITSRLFYWQILAAESLRGMAEKQTLFTKMITPRRGRIYDSEGAPIVLNKRTFLLYAEPQNVKNPNHISSILSKDLLLDEASISAKLNQTSLKWVPITTQVSEETADVIRSQKLEGIGFEEQTSRYYPESSMAAHILGFVGRDAKGEDKGYFGLEGYYDEQLKGKSGLVTREEDAVGRPIVAGKKEEVPTQDGRDIYLTIDKTVQFIAESKLKQGIEKYQAKGGTVTIMEPKSGAILAMASFPSYDASHLDEYGTELYKNPAIASSYEPGSTFKVLVVAAAINENKISPDSVFSEDGPIQIGGYFINTWNHEYHGKIKPAEILQYSSNVGMVLIQRELGQDQLLNYIHKFGFGEITDSDLQEESSPSLRPHEQWVPIDFATASFGQGIAVTPLQMVRAVSTIANGGKLMRPFVVKSIKSETGKIIEVKPKIVRTILKNETAKQVAEMMTLAVSNGETKRLKPAGYRIAGKTGTAQVPIAGHYDSQKTIASFVGFAPVDDPKFVMLVTINEPTTSPWGSETAAPVFFNITKDLFSYFAISPTE